MAHFEKLDKDIANIIKASKTTDILTNSITFMETLRQMEANQKILKKKVLKAENQTAQQQGQVPHGSYLPPYLLINKNALMSAQPTATKNAAGLYKDAHNERAQRQDEIERRLVGQLGDRFKDAQLIEVSEGSYLIQNRIKMPILGKRIMPLIRTKTSTSKRHYLLKKGGLFGKNEI